MKHFYTHLIEIESIILELDKINFSKNQKFHLAHLVDSSLHHTICDAILSHLSDSDKRAFMTHLNENDHDKIWQFLKEKVENVEALIKKSADDLKKELAKDLTEAKKIK